MEKVARVRGLNDDGPSPQLAPATLKYPDPILNAATLLYGICNDHPFHNGNKRTALVSALAHLDKNNLILRATKQTELFNLMIAVADHALLHSVVKIGRNTERSRWPFRAAYGH